MILLRVPNDWFFELLKPVPVRETTRAYLAGVFVDLTKSAGPEISSTVLAYAHACATGRFDKFQELGDWILWTMTFVPGYHSSHETIVLDVGRRSYESCWRIMRGRWDVFAELADEFPCIVKSIRDKLNDSEVRF